MNNITKKLNIIAFMLALFPCLIIAQTSGGQIKRNNQSLNKKPPIRQIRTYNVVQMEANTFYMCINETWIIGNGQDLCRKMAKKGYNVELLANPDPAFGYHVSVFKTRNKDEAVSFFKRFKDERWTIAYPYYNREYIPNFLEVFDNDSSIDLGKPISNGYINGYEYVDLGLPSGLKWASCNIGANSPEESGSYFAWGETSSKDYCRWSTYKLCQGTENSITKYCTDRDYGIIDNLDALFFSDDAARIIWGGSWRIPTSKEIEELCKNCEFAWINKDGIMGMVFIGPNKNWIFFPAAGKIKGISLEDKNIIGSYWSSNLNRDNPRGAYSLNFSDNACFWHYYWPRFQGQTIRPVSD